MIKLKDLLKELGVKGAPSVLNVPKGTWVQVSDKEEKDRLKQNFYDLIQNAYKGIGGHHDFLKPNDVLAPDLQFWKAADVDVDPEVDIVDFGKKTKHGIKHTGIGHDGDRDNIKKLLKAKSKELKTPGHYVEVSGKAFDSYVGVGDAPIIEDEAVAQQILSKYNIEWHGKHPKVPGRKGNGWYTRTSGAGKKFTKILVGMPINIK